MLAMRLQFRALPRLQMYCTAHRHIGLSCHNAGALPWSRADSGSCQALAGHAAA